MVRSERVGYMNLARQGLELDFLGTIMIGAASYMGLSAGFGGPIVWTSSVWQITYFMGWASLATGFLLQRIAAP